jgi:phenylalanyl-tRNA synthetase beta chain
MVIKFLILPELWAERIPKLIKVLEAAIFDPILVRKASKNLKLQTDASYRYERNIDFNGTIFAIQRAMNIILESCKLAKFGKINDIQSDNHDNKIKIDIDKINNLIGGKFNEKEMGSLLAKLNFKLENSIVIVPSYRSHDVKIWQDIAEEVARIYGYNKLGISEISKFAQKDNTNYNIKESLKDHFVIHGFSEVYSYSFTDKKLLELCGFKLSNLKKVINGLTPETEYLRSNLLPSLLTAVAKNPWAPTVKIFEIGKVFDGNTEKWQLGIAVTSKKPTEIENVLKDLNIKAEIFKPDQKILDYLKIRKPVQVAVIDVNKIDVKNESYCTDLKEIHYRKVCEYSPTIRDLAFIADKGINAFDIQKAISESDDHVLIAELFDEFESDKFGNNKKNIAFHVWLQDLNGPMDEKLTNETINKIIANIESSFNAKLRIS